MKTIPKNIDKKNILKSFVYIETRKTRFEEKLLEITIQYKNVLLLSFEFSIES